MVHRILFPPMRCVVCRALGALVFLLLVVPSSEGATTCLFETSGTTLRLTADCSTDTSIVVPNGMTLDGGQFTITAIDPPARAFEGAVVMSGGAAASVINTRIVGMLARRACHAGPQRLRGIFFDGASGTIRGNTVTDLNQGASRCNEGNGIEVRNVVGSGVIVVVEIDDNIIEAFQKSGIVASGDADVWIHDNHVGPSATQESLAANGVQIGFGAKAVVERNEIAGNSWSVDANWAATAVLLFGSAPGTIVRDNDIDGNADIGIHVQADGATIDGNRLFETGADGFYDVGIGNYGMGNVIADNKVRGYTTSYDGNGAKESGPTRVASR
jgi:hypothetical protein